MREDSPLQHTMRVTLELSNRCPLAPFHKRCPAHLVTEHVTLPAEIVYAVLDYMAEEKFGREIAYHNYSEPLVDPRLFSFLDYCRDVGAASKQYILTNGWALDQQMLDELVEHGVGRLWCSAYSEKEARRLEQLNSHYIDYRVLRLRELDLRLEQYERDPIDLHEQCCEPLENLLIRATGDVALCCMDWKGSVTFGNLHEIHLADVLAKPEIVAAYQRNMKGIRQHYPVCRRCKARRKHKPWPEE